MEEMGKLAKELGKDAKNSTKVRRFVQVACIVVLPLQCAERISGQLRNARAFVVQRQATLSAKRQQLADLVQQHDTTKELLHGATKDQPKVCFQCAFAFLIKEPMLCPTLRSADGRSSASGRRKAP